MFLQRFPTPQLLEKAGKRQWEKFLHSRRLWRIESGPRRMQLFAKATEFCGSEPTARAKSMLGILSRMLAVLCTRATLLGTHKGSSEAHHEGLRKSGSHPRRALLKCHENWRGSSDRCRDRVSGSNGTKGKAVSCSRFLASRSFASRSMRFTASRHFCNSASLTGSVDRFPDRIAEFLRRMCYEFVGKSLGVGVKLG
jgi:hypothetical protein